MIFSDKSVASNVSWAPANCKLRPACTPSFIYTLLCVFPAQTRWALMTYTRSCVALPETLQWPATCLSDKMQMSYLVLAWPQLWPLSWSTHTALQSQISRACSNFLQPETLLPFSAFSRACPPWEFRIQLKCQLVRGALEHPVQLSSSPHYFYYLAVFILHRTRVFIQIILLINLFTVLFFFFLPDSFYQKASLIKTR